MEELARAVVSLVTDAYPDSRTAGVLGTHREGNGIVIDREGRILTVGYLVLDAQRVRVLRFDGREFPATVLGYDVDSGLGLVQAQAPLGLEPLVLGDSSRLAVDDPVLLLNSGGLEAARAGTVVSRRTFAAYWEYMVEAAIFTVPPQRDFAGAALLDRDLRVVGVGSLLVQNAASEGLAMAGNLFVPIDRVKPVLRDLVEAGRPRAKARPWLGVNVAEQFGRVIVTRITPGGPARESGLQPGDIILEVDGHKVDGLESFYRQLWGLGPAGIVVKLKLLQRNDVVRIAVTTRDRYSQYRTPPRP